MKRINKLIAMAMCLTMVLSACGKVQIPTKEKTETNLVEVEYKDSDYYFDYTRKDFERITLSLSEIESSDSSVEISERKITITKEGIYVLSGTTDKTLVIDADENAKVYLVLEDVCIDAKNGPAIYEKSSDMLVFLLPPKTENNLSDAVIYSDEYKEKEKSCIFCKDSMTICGEGKLRINGNIKDGVKSKGKLEITGGDIYVSTVKDGIDVENCLVISGGEISILTGEGADVSQSAENGGKGIKVKGDIYISNGNICVNSNDDAINSTGNIMVSGATMNLAASDDGIHSDMGLTISGGEITIFLSCEGLEGSKVTINGGKISATASNDGLNATGSGDNQDKADDDFRKVTKEDWPKEGEDNLASGKSKGDESAIIEINGGDIYIDAVGDGIDSNGYIIMNGGKVFVEGPVDDKNAPIDYDLAFSMNGGEIVAVGSKGMYQSIGEDSKLSSINYLTDSVIPAGTKCELYDGEKLITEFEISKKSQSILISNDSIEEGKVYSLIIGNEKVDIKAEKYLQTRIFGGNMSK